MGHHSIKVSKVEKLGAWEKQEEGKAGACLRGVATILNMIIRQ